MIASGLAIVVAALMTAPSQELRVEPGVSVPLDLPTIAYARGLLRDATAAIAARKMDLTCPGYRGFPGADSCDVLRTLFPLLDQRQFNPSFVGPCYGGSPVRCVALIYPRDPDSYIEVMMRLEPPGTGPAGDLKMSAVEIMEGQYTSD